MKRNEDLIFLLCFLFTDDFIPTNYYSFQDANDNAPLFEQSIYKITVREDLKGLEEDLDGNKIIAKIQASDLDRSPNFGQQSVM